MTREAMKELEDLDCEIMARAELVTVDDRDVTRPRLAILAMRDADGVERWLALGVPDLIEIVAAILQGDERESLIRKDGKHADFSGPRLFKP